MIGTTLIKIVAWIDIGLVEKYLVGCLTALIIMYGVHLMYSEKTKQEKEMLKELMSLKNGILKQIK